MRQIFTGVMIGAAASAIAFAGGCMIAWQATALGVGYLALAGVLVMYAAGVRP